MPTSWALLSCAPNRASVRFLVDQLQFHGSSGGFEIAFVTQLGLDLKMCGLRGFRADVDDAGDFLDGQAGLQIA